MDKKFKTVMKVNITPQDKTRLDELKFMISAKQGQKIPDHELLRRMINIPNVKDILIRDAELKRKRFNYE